MQPNTLVEEPQGIPFFSIKTGETHWCKLEPTIQAYINSSDMGINASRDQDYGWRLAPEWVRKVKAFKRDRTSMSILTAKNDGRKPTTTQILYYMYGEELANYYEELEEHENPFEEAYLAAIASGASVKDAAKQANMPEALADFRALDEEDDIADLIDDVIDEDDDEPTPPAPEEPKQSEAPSEPVKPEVQKASEGASTEVKVADNKVEVPKTDGKTSTRSQKKQ